MTHNCGDKGQSADHQGLIRIGVTAARLVLTQLVEVRILGPEQGPCSSEAEQPTFNRRVEISKFSGGTRRSDN
jgi:hypothetical protein